MPPSSAQTPKDRDGAVRLHIGCGKRNIPGFINVDLLEFPHIDHVTAADDLGFADDDSVDLIYACHILEHFGRKEYENVLREWRRVLKVGGVLRLSVPDFRACASIYYEKGLEDGLSGLIGLISGGQRDEFDFHKMIFDEPFLTVALQRVGFKSTRHWDWRDTDHVEFDDFSQAYIPHMDKETGRLMSLNLEAIK